MAELTNELGGRIRLRRMELGLSQGDLARSIGCQPSGIFNLEKFGDLGNWPTRTTSLLREALGWTWAQLLDDGPKPIDDDLIRRCGAELLRSSGLWEHEIEAEAPLDLLQSLRDALARVGLDVVVSRGRWELVPADGMAPLSRRFEGHHQRVVAGDLTHPEVQVLAAWLSGDLDRQRLGTAQSRALATLIRAGLIPDPAMTDAA